MAMDSSDTSREPDVNDGLRIVNYRAGSDGLCRCQQGYGWQPVNIVNHQAWQEIEKQVDRARRNIAAGKASCLAYYMVANQMTPALLARYTGQSSWLVRLHLRPFVFKRLGRETLQKYADVFQVAPADLAAGELQAPIYQSR